MSQKDIVRNLILKQGYIDNFYCIDNRISIRLGDIIFRLKKEGFEFRTEMQEKNCHYYLIQKPEEEIKEIPVFPKGKLFESPNKKLNAIGL